LAPTGAHAQPAMKLGQRLRRLWPRKSEPDALAEGRPQFRDLIAPTVFETTGSSVVVDGQHIRTVALMGYPRHVWPGWLDTFTNSDLPADVAVHVEPQETGPAVRRINSLIGQHQSSINIAVDKGNRADGDQVQALEDLTQLEERLRRGEDRVFSAALYVSVRSRAADPAEAAAETEGLATRVQQEFDRLLADARVAALEQDTGLRTVLPLGTDLLRVRQNMDTSSLATMFPFGGSGLSSPSGVRLGFSLGKNQLVAPDPFDPALDNWNWAVFAKSGAGKSYLVKLLIARCVLRGAGAFVIDPEGEWQALCEALGAQYVRLGAGGEHRINPFELPPRDQWTPNPLAEQVSSLLVLLDLLLAEPGQHLASYERSILDNMLYQTYRRVANEHGRPWPVMADLHADLERGGTVCSQLATRLWPFVHGSQAGLFEGPTNVRLDSALVAFNTGGLTGPLGRAASHLLTSYMWNRARRDPRPRLLAVDEAWSLDPTFLEAVARRARKYQLGLVTITQAVRDFLADPVRVAVLDNVSTIALLRMRSSSLAAVADVFSLNPREVRFLSGQKRRKGDVLLFHGDARTAFHVEASPELEPLVSTSGTPRREDDDEEPQSAPSTNGHGRPGPTTDYRVVAG
jgi:conjugal transfer ATP-binding protein TraC